MNRKEIYRIDSIEVAPAKATTKYQRNGLHWSWAWVSNHIWEKTSVHTQICQVVKCESFELILQFATLWNSLRLYRKLHHKHIYVLALNNHSVGKIPKLKIPALFFPFLFFYLVNFMHIHIHTQKFQIFFYLLLLFVCFSSLNIYAHAHTC